MSLIPWNPFRDFDNFRSDISSLSDWSPFSILGRMSSPRVDVFENENDIVVKAEMPGVSKKDLNVYVDDYSVRLSGLTKRDKEYKDENIYKAERYYGNFSRTIPLPVEVKSENAKAEYKDGILTITLPKNEFTKSKGQKIDIQ